MLLVNPTISSFLGKQLRFHAPLPSCSVTITPETRGRHVCIPYINPVDNVNEGLRSPCFVGGGEAVMPPPLGFFATRTPGVDYHNDFRTDDGTFCNEFTEVFPEPLNVNYTHPGFRSRNLGKTSEHALVFREAYEFSCPPPVLLSNTYTC